MFSKLLSNKHSNNPKLCQGFPIGIPSEETLTELIKQSNIPTNNAYICGSIFINPNKNIMEKEKAIKLFHDQKVRVQWDDDQEKWYFSIVDVIAILADNSRPRKYWGDLKKKLHFSLSEKNLSGKKPQHKYR